MGRSVFHPPASVPRIAGEKPSDILGIGERGRTAKAALQEVQQAVTVFSDDRFKGPLPEFLFRCGEAVELMTHGLSLVVAADKEELAVIRDKNLIVATPIVRNLLRFGNGEDIFLRLFTLDDAAAWNLADRQFIRAFGNLVGGE